MNSLTLVQNQRAFTEVNNLSITMRLWSTKDNKWLLRKMKHFYQMHILQLLHTEI